METTRTFDNITGLSINRLPRHRLPTNLDVLRFYRHLHDVLGKACQVSLQTVVQNITEIWQKAHHDHQSSKGVMRKLKKLVDRWKQMGKDTKKTNSKTVKNIKDFKDGLRSTFDIKTSPLKKLKTKSSPNFEEPSSSSEEASRVMAERFRRRPAVIQESEREEGDAFSGHEDQEPEEEECPDDPEYSVPEKKKAAKRINVFNNSVAENFDREKISNRAAVGIIGSIADSLKVDLNHIAMSKSTVYRKRKKAREQIVAEIMQKFNKCNGVVVHFDGKQLVTPNRTKREMLAVVVTGNDSTEQILTCKFLQSGTGGAIAKHVCDSLKLWGLENFVKGMAYDTTNVNSGEKNGAGVLLQKHLGRKLLDLPCRHHMYELVLKTAYTVVFQTSTTSPDDKIFKAFRESWDTMDQSNFHGVDTELNPEECAELVDFFRKMMQKSYVRDDYEELLQLAIMCLDPNTRFKFRLPGAVHHARWMARAIYGLKMFLFRHQFSYEGVTDDMMLRFVLFTLRIYLKGWFQAPVPLSAPRNDLNFAHALKNYDDSELAQSTLEKFKRHFWYLSEINVCLAFFDSGVDNDVKRSMVQKLSKKSSGRGSNRAKTFKSTLPEYVSQRSLEFFGILEVDTEFLLNKDPSTWPTDPNFMHGKACSENLCVTNDCAERAVALATEFNGTGPKDETEKNQLLLTVSKNRKGQKNSSKAAVIQYLSENAK